MGMELDGAQTALNDMSIDQLITEDIHGIGSDIDGLFPLLVLPVVQTTDQDIIPFFIDNPTHFNAEFLTRIAKIVLKSDHAKVVILSDQCEAAIISNTDGTGITDCMCTTKATACAGTTSSHHSTGRGGSSSDSDNKNTGSQSTPVEAVGVFASTLDASTCPVNLFIQNLNIMSSVVSPGDTSIHVDTSYASIAPSGSNTITLPCFGSSMTANSTTHLTLTPSLNNNIYTCDDIPGNSICLGYKGTPGMTSQYHSRRMYLPRHTANETRKKLRRNCDR
jgi:hypothetical protein